MYELINHFAKTVVDTIPPEHVTDYEGLLQNVGQASTPDYQKRYRRFWAMNAAQLSPPFYATYFNTLVAAMSQPPALSSVAQTLHAASARQNGQKSLQFSFATKLLHNRLVFRFMVATSKRQGMRWHHSISSSSSRHRRGEGV